jgi:outer membrane protein TolC
VIKNKVPILVSTVLLAATVGRSQEPTRTATPSPAHASTSDPVLEELVAEALRNNADVARALSSAEAASLRIDPARALPDPSISFNYQNDGKALSLGEREMTFLGAMYSQPLPWPGKLRLAGEEARSRAEEVREGTVGRARLAVEARVRRAYYDYLLAREELALIEDRSVAWRQLSEIARNRYSAGLGVQQDMLRAQVEVLRLDEARAERAAQAANRRAELNRLLGRPQDAEILTSARLVFRPDSPGLPAVLQAVHDRSPELAAASRSVEAAGLRADLAKKNLLPDFVASGGPMYRGGLDPMWQVGLAVSLPVFAKSRQRPLIASAQAEVHAEQARASSAAQELEFRTRERFENLSAALKIARLYEDAVLPVDRLSLESAIAGYRTGKVPFVTVLEALNTLYSDRSLSLARLAEAEKWRVSIDEADLQADSAMGTVSGAPAPAGIGAPGTAAVMGSPSTMR